MARFYQTLPDDHHKALTQEAEKKYPNAPGALQKLIRFNVVPDWLKANGIEIPEKKKK